MRVCLDTHVLLWWALDPDQLSDIARALCQEMSRIPGCVSAISIWEIGLKIKNGHLDIGTSIEDFTQRVIRTGEVEIIPVTETIWMKNLALDWDHRDPADRTIVATALTLGVPVLSKDQTLRAFKSARIIW